MYRYVGTYHQDNYALGASKVFLRESMEGALETERQDIQEVIQSLVVKNMILVDFRKNLNNN